VISFVVPGLAAPAGSKRAFAHKGTGKVVTMDANPKAKPWQADCKVFAAQAMAGREPLAGPVRVTMRFYRPRPKSHYTAKGGYSSKATARPVGRPDVLKLARAVEDAISGICYGDDAQIVSELLEKRWGYARCEVRVAALEPGCVCGYSFTMQAQAGCPVHGVDAQGALV
jgi:crossover junction endodeoxyribonuclease RusA